MNEPVTGKERDSIREAYRKYEEMMSQDLDYPTFMRKGITLGYSIRPKLSDDTSIEDLIKHAKRLSIIPQDMPTVLQARLLLLGKYLDVDHEKAHEWYWQANHTLHVAQKNYVDAFPKGALDDARKTLDESLEKLGTKIPQKQQTHAYH